MIKLTLLLLPLIISATMLKINEDINPIMLKSQHNKNYTLLSDGIWIITWDKSSSHIVNDYFKNNHFLLCCLFAELFGCGSSNKKLDKFVFNTNKKFIKCIYDKN